MNDDDGRMKVWLWITIPIILLLIVASASGLFINGLYRDTPNFAAQARGQDLISLLVVSPTLIVVALLAKKGSARAYLVWLGGLVYLIYSYLIAVFDVRFNSLFLAYVALLGCSLYGLIGGLATANTTGIKACFSDRTPIKAISIYLLLLATLFYILWLSEIVPALFAGTIPQSVQDNGTPTNAVHALDMAWILPAFAITAISLWRKHALGYTLAGALLSYTVLLILSVLSMVLFMIIYGHPVIIPQVIIFGVLFVINLGMLVSYLKNLKSPPNQD